MSPASQNLVLRFPFDEIEDNRILDASGKGNDGTVQGSARILPDDTFGSCLDLDGQTTSVRLQPQSVPAGTAITVSFWARGGPALPSNTSILCATDANGTRTVNIHLPWGNGTIYFDCGNDGTNFDRIQKDAQPTDYKSTWTHWAFTKNATAGEMRIYLNGALWHSDTGKTMPIPAAAQVTLGAYAPGAYPYQGQVANLRIYSQALSAEEIAQDIEDDRTAIATFRASSPLDFFLRDADDQDVLYIDDDPQTDILRLGITNTSRQVIELAAPANGAASADNHHFELKFRPGTLSAATLTQLTLAEAGWSISVVRQPDGGVSVYLLSASTRALEPAAAVILTLQHISADPGGGSRGTRVELAYQQLQYQGETIPLGGSRIKHLDIVNQRGKKTIPINVGYIGSSTILNDGKTPNTLVVRLTNVSPTDTITLNPFDSATPSKFIISFDVTGDWALATEDQVSQIEIVGRDWGGSHGAEDDWHIQKETAGSSPQWTLTHLNKTEPGLAPGHVVQLTISNIISSAASGQTNLYVYYENIPGYWDGQFFRTIEKGPLLVSNHNVGIGTATPASPLHVKGEVRIEGQLTTDPQFRILVDHHWNEFNQTLLKLETNYQNDANRSRVLLYAPNNYYTNVPAITLAGNYGAGAKVGIGTADPAAPLHVVGAGLIGEGHNFANASGYMAAGSLTIGSITANYGGGSNWNANTAGLLLETVTNTEIAVHDSGTRVASLMYYEGDTANRITIGRDMGWGTIGTLALNGKVGIGAPAPTELLQISNFSVSGEHYLKIAVQGTSGGVSLAGIKLKHWSDDFGFTIKSDDNANPPGLNILRHQQDTAGHSSLFINRWDGSVGIGSNAPDRPLTIVANGQSQELISFKDPTGATKWHINQRLGGTLPGFNIVESGVADGRLFIQAGGNVGISTITPQARLHVVGAARIDGALSAQTKSFRIDHPAKPGHTLVHACLEGPENGVYYRGTARLKDGVVSIRLPGYFEALTRRDGRTVMLTPRGREPFLLSYEAIAGGAFSVYSDKDEGEFDWEVKAVRADVGALEVEVQM